MRDELLIWRMQNVFICGLNLWLSGGVYNGERVKHSTSAVWILSFANVNTIISVNLQ